LDENCLFDKKNTKTIKSFLIDETKFFQQENLISFIFPFSLMNQNATKILQLKGKFAAKMQKLFLELSKNLPKRLLHSMDCKAEQNFPNINFFESR
jgi:hypothetical protein